MGQPRIDGSGRIAQEPSVRSCPALCHSSCLIVKIILQQVKTYGTVAISTVGRSGLDYWGGREGGREGVNSQKICCHMTWCEVIYTGTSGQVTHTGEGDQSSRS